VAALVGLLLIVPAWRLSSAEYTAWATAVQAFGTVMAFVAAFTAFAWQWAQTRTLEQQRAAFERASQASRVAGWLVLTGSGQDEGYEITVRNSSDLPVTRLMAMIVDGRYGPPVGEPAAFDCGIVAPFDPVPPSTTLRTRTGSPGGASGWRPSVQIAFTDAAGRHWVRRPDGALFEIDVSPGDLFNYSFWSYDGLLHEDALRPADG
jgi:hypothetical protein